jgi:hypothetical protein
MAFRKTQRKSGTGRQTRTTSIPGGRTRVSTTRKLSHGFTQSRSVNPNGTVKVRTTHKTPAGIQSTKQKTFGSAPRKPKAPKFIKAKPFKLPKLGIFRNKAKVYTPKVSGGRSSSSGGSEGGFGFIDILLLPIIIPIWLISLPFRFVFWLIGWLASNPITWITIAVLLYIYW